MPLFKKPDEAEQHFNEGKRYAEPGKKEFDLNLAVQELKQAIMLKPEEPKYHAELGAVYMRVPELAVTHRIDVGFRLAESANLALSAFDKVIELCEGNPSHFHEYWKYCYESWERSVYAYLCLEQKEKAKSMVSCVPNSCEHAVIELNEGDADLIIGGLANVGPAVAEMLEGKLFLWKEMGGLGNAVDTFKEGIQLLEGEEISKRSPTLREIMEAEENPFKRVLLERRVSSKTEGPRTYLEQAVLYRNLGKHKDAKKEIEKARWLAPSMAWWYRTLCEVGS